LPFKEERDGLGENMAGTERGRPKCCNGWDSTPGGGGGYESKGLLRWLIIGKPEEKCMKRNARGRLRLFQSGHPLWTQHWDAVRGILCWAGENSSGEKDGGCRHKNKTPV